MKCTVQIEFPCWTEINMQHKPQSCLKKQQLGILGSSTSVAAKTQKCRKHLLILLPYQVLSSVLVLTGACKLHLQTIKVCTNQKGQSLTEI